MKSVDSAHWTHAGAMENYKRPGSLWEDSGTHTCHILERFKVKKGLRNSKRMSAQSESNNTALVFARYST